MALRSLLTAAERSQVLAVPTGGVDLAAHYTLLPAGALDYVALQVSVPVDDLASYWGGRSVKYHRAEIRSLFGFREFTRADEPVFSQWLALRVCPAGGGMVRKRAEEKVGHQGGRHPNRSRATGGLPCRGINADGLLLNRGLVN